MPDTQLGRLVVEIAGDATSLINTYKLAQQETEALEGKLNQISDTLTGVGKNMTLKVTAPLVALGGISLYTASTFDDSMRQVMAVTRATGEEFEELRALALELGSTTAWTASEAAQAMRFLGMAGLDTNEILAATPQMLSLASAGTLDLASAADISTNVMSGFRLEVEDLSHVSDILALSSASANTNVQQMGEAMAYVGPVAASANQSIEQTAAGIMVLSNAGIQGSSAGTGLRRAMTSLMNPTAEATAILAKYGITAEQVNPEVHSLAEVIGALEDAELSASDVMTIFGERGGPAMNVLLAEGGDAILEYTDLLEDCDGSAQEMAETMGGGVGGSLRELKSAMEGASIAFGDVIADSLLPMIEGVTELFQWISELDDGTKQLIVTTALFAAAVGPATWALGSMAGGVSNLISLYRTYQTTTFAATVATKGFTAAIAANPIGLAIIGVTTLAVALIPLISQTDEAAKSQERYNELLEETSDLTDKTAEEIRGEIDELTELIETRARHIAQIESREIPVMNQSSQAVRENTRETNFDRLAKGDLLTQSQQLADTINDEEYAVRQLTETQQDNYLQMLKEAQAKDEAARLTRELELYTRDLADGAQTAYEESTKAVNAYRDSVSDLTSEYNTLKEAIDRALSIEGEISDAGRDTERADIRVERAKKDLEEIRQQIKDAEGVVRSGDAEARAAAVSKLEDLRLREREAVLDLADAEDRYSEAIEEQQALQEEKVEIEKDLNGESVESAQARLTELEAQLEEETANLETALKAQEEAKVAHENLINQIDLAALDTRSENWKKYVEFIANNPAMAETYHISYDEEGKPSYVPTVQAPTIALPEYSAVSLPSISGGEEPGVGQAQSKGDINVTINQTVQAGEQSSAEIQRATEQGVRDAAMEVNLQ